MRFSELAPPFRLRKIRRLNPPPAPLILDVGCASGSPQLTKRFFPDCRYHAIDISPPNKEMASYIDQLFLMDLDSLNFEALSPFKYDIIIASHVIEHLKSGLRVLSELADHLKPGGVMYVEYPAARSIGFPRAVNTLQFCDDPTHIRLYDLTMVANALLEKNLQVIDGGTRRDWIRILLAPLAIPLQIATLFRHGRLNAKGLWDICGFAEFVIGHRRPSVPT